MFSTTFLPSSVGASKFFQYKHTPFNNSNPTPGGLNFFSGYTSDNLSSFNKKSVPRQNPTAAWPLVQPQTSAPIEPVGDTVYQKKRAHSALMDSVNTSKKLKSLHEENRNSVVYQNPINTNFKYDYDTGDYISNLILPPLSNATPFCNRNSSRKRSSTSELPKNHPKIAHKKRKKSTIFD